MELVIPVSLRPGIWYVLMQKAELLQNGLTITVGGWGASLHHYEHLFHPILSQTPFCNRAQINVPIDIPLPPGDLVHIRSFYEQTELVANLLESLHYVPNCPGQVTIIAMSMGNIPVLLALAEIIKKHDTLREALGFDVKVVCLSPPLQADYGQKFIERWQDFVFYYDHTGKRQEGFSPPQQVAYCFFDRSFGSTTVMSVSTVVELRDIDLKPACILLGPKKVSIGCIYSAEDNLFVYDDDTLKYFGGNWSSVSGGHDFTGHHIQLATTIDMMINQPRS